jgi:hypothetical protein
MRVEKGLAVLLTIGVWACTPHEELEPPDNPLDPNNPVYTSPSAEIISGPTEGEIVETTSISITWEGNESATEYRYNFDSNEWSEWTSITSQTYDYLDEGDHSFEIQARSVNGDEQTDSHILGFSVDAVAGPSAIVYPYKQTANPGDTIVYKIMAEEVTNVFANECKISFDTDYLELIDVIEGDILGAWGGSPLLVEMISDSSVSISMVAAEGSSISFSGTSSLIALILRINPRAISGSGLEVIRITDITYLNPNLEKLHVNSNRLGVLNVR